MENHPIAKLRGAAKQQNMFIQQGVEEKCLIV